MEFIIEIIFQRIIIRFFGLYTRYFFFRLIGKKKNIVYLSGDNNKFQEGLSQDFFNALVGIIVFSSLVVLIVNFLDKFF